MKIGGIPDYVRFENSDYLSDLYENILYKDIIVRHHIGKEKALRWPVFSYGTHKKGIAK